MPCAHRDQPCDGATFLALPRDRCQIPRFVPIRRVGIPRGLSWSDTLMKRWSGPVSQYQSEADPVKSRNRCSLSRSAFSACLRFVTSITVPTYSTGLLEDALKTGRATE